MHPIEELFEIESTENERENMPTDRLIDFSANEEVQRFTKEEIDRLKAEIIRVEKMLATKK